jgi:hypothetical protein
LFGAADDKYVVTTGYSILVINTKGEVWAHDLTKSDPKLSCPDTVNLGYKLGGPSLFSAPNDKYVIFYNNSYSFLLVINTLGEVWAHYYDGTTVGRGNKLKGPGVFEDFKIREEGIQLIQDPPDDKYVIAFPW